MRTVISGGTLITGTGEPPMSGRAIVIEGDRIDSILDEAEARHLDGYLIDASGLTVLPGLINMHEHFTFRELVGNPATLNYRNPIELTVLAVRNAQLALSRGWTTVSEMASAFDISQNLRDLIEGGDMKGPRVMSAGRPICVTGGHASSIAHLCREADGADGCREATRANFKAGADFVKVMASEDPCPMPGPEQTRPEMSLDEIRAVFEEAHRWGRLAMSHVMGTQAIRNVLDADVDVVHHGIYLDFELAQRMVEQEVFYCPTLSAYQKQTMHPVFDRGEDWAKAHSVLVEPHRRSMEAAVRAGVTVVTGTDSTGSYAEEVELMRSAGMDAMDSLLACTLNAARALRLDSKIGSIEQGKLADIVLLNGDPIADPYALQQVDLVVKGGISYRPADLIFESTGGNTWIPTDHYIPER